MSSDSSIEPHVALDDQQVALLVAAVVLALKGQIGKSASLLLDQRETWEFLGLSRAAFFRLKNADKLPKPVHVDGVGIRYRRADLEQFVAKLKPARRKPVRESLDPTPLPVSPMSPLVTGGTS